MKIIAKGIMPDGYNGHTAKVGFAIKGNTVVTVTERGAYFNTGLPSVQNVAAALWLLEHHPTAKHITLTKKSSISHDCEMAMTNWNNGDFYK